MKCPQCGHDVRDHERNCPVCQRDCGYPNVRAAERPEEVRALEERLRSAEAAAAARGCESVLVEFRNAARSSLAVLCQSLSKVMKLVSSDNELYASFYQLVGLGARRPEDTEIEMQRLLADDILFPYYREEIRFAALSLDGQGVVRFGECSLVLTEETIRDRTTVFEENSLYFCSRRGLGVRAHSVPPGFRASWSRREQLAAAKLEPALQPAMSAPDFVDVILKGGKPPNKSGARASHCRRRCRISG